MRAARIARRAHGTLVVALLASVPLGAALVTAVPLAAQETEASCPPDGVRDLGSPQAIVETAYDVISGPAGMEVDRDRFQSLFLPEARLMWTGRGPAGDPVYRVWTPEEFVDRPPRTQGFYENGLHAVTECFGDIAHVFATYESRQSPDAAPFARGINSFQLWHDGERWWIVSIAWHEEREGLSIPDRYTGR